MGQGRQRRRYVLDGDGGARKIFWDVIGGVANDYREII
jgi:hypothetical protein